MKQLKLLFCTAPYHPYNLADEKVYVTEPLQFEVLSSLIDHEKFDVDILDLRIERKKGVFTKTLKKINPDILCMTSWTMHVALVKEHFKIAKNYNPNIITVVGGEHTRIDPSDFAIKQTDFILMGEAYTSFNLLLEGIYNKTDSFKEVQGIAYQENNKFYSNGQGIIKSNFDLNSLPFPDRKLTAKYHSKYYHLWWKPIASIRTAMGCPSRCSFCNLWKVNLGKYLQWTPEYIVKYLKTINQKYILIVDDHFFGDIRRAYKIGNAILESGIKKEYCLYSRADAIVKNPELVKLWAKIGLKRVRMGLETFSDRLLEEKNKCSSVSHNDDAIKILKKYNVYTEGLFMVELDFSKKEFDELEHYIKSREIEVPNITLSTPMPGTVDYKLHEPHLIYKKYEYFDFQHATMETKLDIKEFCRLYSKLMFNVQRPPLEQIRLIGFTHFLKRMPSFWKYFWSLKNSYKHYIPENRVDFKNGYDLNEHLEWIKKSSKNEKVKKDLKKTEMLYSRS